MKMRAQVDLKNRWQCLVVSAYMAILCGIIFSPVFAQFDIDTNWRRTNRGWEYAHAVQPANMHTGVVSARFEGSRTYRTMGKLHGIVLPIAVCSFLITFSCWSLIGVQNEAMARLQRQSHGNPSRAVE